MLVVLLNKTKMKTKKYEILFKGSFLENQVSIDECSSTRVIDPTIEAEAKKYWDKMLADAQAQGKKLWDSDIYRFEKSEREKNTVHLELSTIPFSVRYAMNKLTADVAKLGPAYYPLGMFTSCLVKSADNKYVFIEKSDKYYANKRVPFIGGILSRSEKVLTSGGDLFDEVAKEIKEELGLDDMDIDSIVLRSGHRSENFNVCLLFEVHLNLSIAEIQEIFAHGGDGEAKKVLGMTKAELKTFIPTLEEKEQIKFEILETELN